MAQGWPKCFEEFKDADPENLRGVEWQFGNYRKYYIHGFNRNFNSQLANIGMLLTLLPEAVHLSLD